MEAGMKGKLIIVEGLDGSGKSTQIELLRKRAEEQGVWVRQIKFPNYEEDSSALVRAYLNGELGGLHEINAYAASTLYSVDRYATWRRHMKEDYDAGCIFLLDRYTTSNMYHQTTKLPEAQWDEFLGWLEDLEYDKMELPRPDLVLYLDMKPQTSRKLLENTELRALLPPEGPVLVLGVGNRRVTADALGPRTVQKIFVTMGAGHPAVRGIRPVAAVAPGVAASTGMSLQQLAGALVHELRPAALLCVDSLCSAEPQRLGRTLQFSDTGLCPAQPGSARHLDARRLGVPVVAAGIPTLMEAKEGRDLVVTPRELDSVIAHGAALLGTAINRALQPRLSIAQLCWLAG